MKQKNSKQETNGNQNKIIKQFFAIHDKPGNQMLMDIMDNDNFEQICSKMNYSNQTPVSGQQDYINMLIYEQMLSQKQQLQLEKAVSILEQVDYNMDCQIDQEKIKQVQGNKQIVEEDIEILTHQNQKIFCQTKISKENIPNNQNNKQQLERLLNKYHCQCGFPKNKSQALKLIGKLQVQIQKLQVTKITQNQKIQDNIQ